MKDANVSFPDGFSVRSGRSWLIRTATTLLQKVRDNDPDGWRRLADLYGPWVYAIGRGKGLSPEDAGDVTQETFRAIYRYVGRFDHDYPGASFRGWVKTITLNKVRDHWRRCGGKVAGVGGSDAYQRLQQLPERSGSPPSSGDEAEAQVAHDEVRWLYRRAMELVRDEFTPATWQAFWETTVACREPADVAAELGMTRNAVYVAKSRVLSRLRAELCETMDRHDPAGNLPQHPAA